MNASIQAEIKQGKPFESLEQEAFLALLWTADRLQWRLTEALKPHGLSPTQYNVLRILRGAGKQGLACSEVAQRMITRDPDITRLMDRLGRMGLAHRGRGDEDRRIVVAKITPKGVDLLKQLDPVIRQFLHNLLGHMGEKKLNSLLGLLDKAFISAN
ncbi:MAG: MarR family winged helix-turn-helix transcriptional regulator [Candidatus Angelobacter sp.]